MKHLKLVLLLIFVIPAMVFSQTGPKFSVDGGESINTGTHMRGKEVKYEIKFKNSGDAELKISNVSTSCGCSTALISADVIKPGEDGTISFTFNGNGFGMVSKAVNVITNEAAGLNTHSIVMTMNMVDPVNLTPNSIITEGKVGDEISQKVTVANFFDKDIAINEVSSNSPAVKVSCDKQSIAVGETATIDISIKLYEESDVNAAVTIKTSEGEFQVPVLVTAKAK